MYRGLVEGGPLASASRPRDYFVMLQPDSTVTCCVGPGGMRVLRGSQLGDPGELAVEYGWTWGMWLCGESLAAARIARDVGA